MPLIYRAREDIFASPNIDVIVHYPTLDFGWEKGLPAVFKRRYPEMYKDWEAQLTIGKIERGVPYVFKPDNGPVIINLPLKESFMDGQDDFVLTEAFRSLNKKVSELFPDGAKVVLPIVVFNDGISWALETMGDLLDSRNVLYEVSLMPNRLQGYQGQRRVVAVSWESAKDPKLVKHQIRRRLKELGVHGGNTQKLLCDESLSLDVKGNTAFGYNLGNPLTHTRFDFIDQNKSGWLRQKGIDGILRFTGQDELGVSLELFE